MSGGGGGRRDDGGASPAVRALAVGFVLVAAVAVAVALLAGDGGYRVTAEFANAGQLVKGGEVRVAGAAVGTVQEIDVSEDGMAEVTFSVDDEYAPLRRGTQAIIR